MTQARKDIETISNVFKTVGQPTVTYVKRESGKLEKKLSNALKTPGNLCLITGPSKTGKTTLYRKVLSDLNIEPLIVRCDKSVSSTEFWSKALESINFSRIKDLTHEKKVEAKLAARLGAKIGWAWLAEASGQISAEAAAGISEEKAKEMVLSQPSPMHLIPALKNLPLALVVEDYHYLTNDVQKVIFQQWKTFVDEEVSAIVLGTTHHAIDVISSNKDLLARLLHIEVESWAKEDLRKIVESGFSYLDIPISQKSCDLITEESVGLPIVTQSICEQVFHDQGIFDHEKEHSVATGKDAITRAMISTAREKFGSFSQYYDRLIVGPRKRARKYDTYELVLSCFALSPLKFGLAKHQIMERLQMLPMPQQKIPPLGSVNSMLNALERFQDKQSFDLLEWQRDEQKLYILEPCFLFFVRWGLENSQAKDHRVIEHGDPPITPSGIKEILQRLLELDFESSKTSLQHKYR